MKNQRIAIAGEKITIPENTRVIIEDGVIVFESKEKPVLKVGDWIQGGDVLCLILQEDIGNKDYPFKICGFMGSDWFNDDRISSFYKCSSADMKEVGRLSLKEAEKRGFKKGVTAKVNNNARKLTSDPYTNTNGILANDNESGWVMLFDFKTGKWAEIIEEKKPFINCYGTEFRAGDEHWTVMNGIIKGPYGIESSFNPTSISCGALTKRECHQWLADNWDKLK